MKTRFRLRLALFSLLVAIFPALGRAQALEPRPETPPAAEQQQVVTTPDQTQNPLQQTGSIKVPSRLQTASRAFLYSATGLDMGTTLHGLKYGRREANPLLGQHRLRISAQIIGTTVAADIAATALARVGHPRWAAFSRFLLGSLHLGASLQNLR